MTSAIQVASEVVHRLGALSSTKLHCLVYYCQAWHLVWEETPLFRDRIEAWASGPVVPTVHELHKEAVEIREPFVEDRDFSKEELETVEAVLKFYGHRPARWLAELTHREAPWRNARGFTPPGESSRNEIPVSAMADYYFGLL